MKRLSLFKIGIVCVVLSAMFVQSVSGQRWKLRRYEVGGGLGMTQVFGDIGGAATSENFYGLKDIRFDETSLVFPAYLRYKLDPVYSLKTNLALGFGNGDDADSKNNRGRSYSTTLVEFSVQGEYYFIAEEKKFRSAAMFNRRGMINNYMSFSAYGFLGLGATYSNAKVSVDPEWGFQVVDDIKPSNFGMVIPFGVGTKFILDDRWLLFGELGYRYSLTDYIEGYTQTVGSRYNDVYYFLTISVGYRLETSRKGLPGFMDREYRKMKSSKTRNRNKPKSQRQALD